MVFVCVVFGMEHIDVAIPNACRLFVLSLRTVFATTQKENFLPHRLLFYFLFLLLLEYFNLYSNQLTGTLPKDLRFRRVTYFDVGRNQLTGKIPEELGENMVTLRHLHLDHNDFRGTLPKEYNDVGNGRLESFSINHNRLTGTYYYVCMCVYRCHAPRFKNIKLHVLFLSYFCRFLLNNYHLHVSFGWLCPCSFFFKGTVPGERSLYNKLVQYTLHNNRFDRMDQDTCRIEVPQGECVELR